MKEYKTPLFRIRLFTLAHAVMNYSETAGDDEGDDFNAKHRLDDEGIEEAEPNKWGETANSLW